MHVFFPYMARRLYYIATVFVPAQVIYRCNTTAQDCCFINTHIKVKQNCFTEMTVDCLVWWCLLFLRSSKKENSPLAHRLRWLNSLIILVSWKCGSTQTLVCLMVLQQTSSIALLHAVGDERSMWMAGV
jgi:hypothetical protein